jgi:hypothetical protein
MPASEQVFLECDYDGCGNTIRFDQAEYPKPADEEAYLAEHGGWGMYKVNGKTFYYHCPSHSRELARYFGAKAEV